MYLDIKCESLENKNLGDWIKLHLIVPIYLIRGDHNF